MLWAVGLLVALLAGSVFLYNRLVALQKRAEGAWADIDAQLKRRHDVVPALVEVVKGYAAHERETLEAVVQTRAAATQHVQGRRFPGATASQIENGLVEALRGLFALAEAYPEIRASERYGTLQRQLSEIEDDLQSARRYYNAVVRDHNTAIASFPAVLVAAPLGFAVRQFFEIENPLERHAVRVDLDA